MPDARLLDRLALLAGIEPRYRDAFGTVIETDPEVKVALLRAKGLCVDTDRDAAAEIAAWEERPWRRWLDPVCVWPRRRTGGPAVHVHLPGDRAEVPIEWVLELEGGETRRGTLRPAALPIEDIRAVDGRAVERRRFVLPVTPPEGYHRFLLRDDGGGREAEHALIVTPNECYLPPELQGGGAIWGIAVQLYALRSERNWGIGDFTDLCQFCEIAQGLGAQAIGLNPLHTLSANDPDHASPYSPSSRTFLNPLYLDVVAVPDFAEAEPARALAASTRFRAELGALRRTPLVDYAGAARAKRRILELLYESFRHRHLGEGEWAETARGRDFREYQRRAGGGLQTFGVFEALSEHFGINAWKGWPRAYRRPDNAAVRDFARAGRQQVEFHQYLQWETARQLGAANETARRLGMVPGLYHDLALGVDADGMEAWARQDLLATGASLGAPPDHWSFKGQNWGAPPIDPDALREQTYRPYADMLRVSMSRGGALRIDHVMSLMRLYWIPEGAEPSDGAYVRYPFEDLLGILALESRRQQCMLIGEDLGTVPEDFQARTQAAGVLSYRVLYFQQDAKGEFLPPAEYPRRAAAAVGTHDLATLPGWWTGHDLEVRSALGLFPTKEARDTALATRARERENLLSALKNEGLLPPDFEPGDGGPDILLIEAVYRFLGMTPSLVSIVHLEDILGEIDQVNLPGTTDQHPNWRSKVLVRLEDLAADPRIARIAAALREVRANAGGRREMEA